MSQESNLQRAALFASVAGGLGVLLWNHLSHKGKGIPYPPGPKPLPFLGNILDYPIDYSWLTLDRYAKQYGDIIHLKVGPQHIIILSSLRAVEALLEKRSAIYSDRPQSTMLCEIMGWNFSFIHMPYGDAWRVHRRAFHGELHQRAVPAHQGAQLAASRRFVADCVLRPEDALHLSHLMMGATIKSVVYGLESQGDDDKYIKLADEVIRRGAKATVPGAFLVDIIPALRYVPSWMPGARWKRYGKETATMVRRMVEEPFLAARAQLEHSTSQPSMVASLLGQGTDETVVKRVAGVAYAAGTDTTQGVISLFLNAVMNHPAVQQRAQAELDAVIGRERLPDFGDRENLPYINALIKELLRWQPMTPLAAPHATIADDVYDGYFIPKGSFIMGNVWSISRDPDAYPDPDTFRPERFLRTSTDGVTLELDPSVRDPVRFCFGFGRRVCPGRHLAEQTLFAVVATLLATCDVVPMRDARGRAVDAALEMTPTILSTPAPFKCRIKPRSARAVELIHAAVESH